MGKKDEPANFIQREASTRRTTKENHWREIEIFTGIINTFLSGLSSVGAFQLQENNEGEYVWLLILIRSLNSVRCSIDLMLKGYYSQAMSLLRTVTEDWFVCGTVQGNITVRDCLLRDAARMPHYSQLAREMKATKIYKGDYKYQSKFTHSSRLSLRVLYDLDRKEAVVAPTYNELLFLLCAESLMRVSLLILEYMGRLLLYGDENKAKAWAEQNSQHIEDMSSWLGELRAKYRGDA